MSDTQKLLKNFIVDATEILIISAAVIALAWVFLVEPLEVSGDSMAPTLHNKEQIVVEKVSMNFSELKHGDIVVFNSPENENMLVIKRLIGLPGDTVTIREGHVYLNNTQLDEPYLDSEITTKGKEIEEAQLVKVPSDAYFVLGDNRDNSMDSRDFGLVKMDKLVGKAVLVYYPFENIRVLKEL